MYITEGHFLSPFIVILRDGKKIGRILSLDTDLKVGIRLTGFDPDDGSPITDLVAFDEVIFVTEDMPEELKSIIPAGYKIVKNFKLEEL